MGKSIKKNNNWQIEIKELIKTREELIRAKIEEHEECLKNSTIMEELPKELELEEIELLEVNWKYDNEGYRNADPLEVELKEKINKIIQVTNLLVKNNDNKPHN